MGCDDYHLVTIDEAPIGIAGPKYDHSRELAIARACLAEADTLPAVTRQIDGAEAMRVFTRKIGLSHDAQNDWAEYKLDAERKAGQMLTDMGEMRGRPKKAHDAPLSEIGVSRLQSQRWQRVALLSDEDYNAYKQAAREHGREITEAEVIRLAKRYERHIDQRRRAKEQAAIAPEPAIITKASWDEWLPTQPDCDLLLTDPPYSTDIDEDIDTFAQRWLPAALNKVKPTGRAYICIGTYWDELRAYLNIPTPDHLVHANAPLIWTYRNTMGPAPTYDYKLNAQAILYYWGQDAAPLDCPLLTERFSVQDINAPQGNLANRWHAWQKPDQLAERFIRHATKPGDLVLDPFTCTGTFILAAARLGRPAYGCEIDPDNIDIAIERGCFHAE